jgi:hypothetical protein
MSLTLEEIYKIPSKKEMAYMVPDAGVIFIADDQGHTHHIYKKQENGLFSELELNLHEMALKLSEGLDKVEFLKDVLKTMPVEQLLQLKEILPQETTQVKSKGGCFNLIVSTPTKNIKMVLR